MANGDRSCGNCANWQCTPRFYVNGSDRDQGECRVDVRPVPTHRDYWCGRWQPEHNFPPAEGAP